MSNIIVNILNNAFLGLVNNVENVNSIDKGIYIFGTGQGGKEILKQLMYLCGMNSSNYIIKGFFDNDQLKHSTRLEGVKITEPHVIDQGDVVLIASLKYDAEMFKQLINLGINKNQIVHVQEWLHDILVGDDRILGHEVSKYAAFIDIVDTCNLGCATCFRSTIKGTRERMKFSLFCKILDKLQALNTQIVGLYNWTEPFLHPELLDFVREVKRRSMMCSLSSNLALANIPQLCDVLEVLEPDDGDCLVVSVSGMQQSIYEINHIGGRIETVLKNLELASKSKNKLALRVKFLRFDYNHEEEDKLIDFCMKIGISYEIINASGNPREHRDMKVSNASSSSTRELKSMAPCVYTFNQMMLDVRGDVYLCCCTPPHQNYNVGSFLEQDIADITIKKYFHPACAVCTMQSRREFSKENLRLITEGLLHVRP